MEYRGCADPHNLPFNVNPNANCKYQGPGKSLWYFCDGDRCNNGQIGQDHDYCGQSSTPKYYSSQGELAPSEEDTQESENSVYYDDHYSTAILNSPDHLPLANYEIHSDMENGGQYMNSNPKSESTTSWNYDQRDNSGKSQQVGVKSFQKQDSSSKSGYNQASHGKSGYTEQNSRYKSGYNQAHTPKSEYIPSGPPNNDVVSTKNQLANSDIYQDKVTYPEFQNHLQK